MSDWLMRVIKAEAERLIELAADDDELRADLRALAESILAATESRSHADGKSLRRRPRHGSTVLRPRRSRRRMSRSGSSHWDGQGHRNAIPGRTRRRYSSPRPRLTTSSDLENRCRRKGEAARWAAERLRRAREGNDCRDRKRADEPEMVAWADRLMDSFYWSQASDSVAASRSRAASTMWAGASRRSPRHWHSSGPCWRNTRATRRSWNVRCRWSPKRNPG